MIRLLLKYGIGSLIERNHAGRLPLEIPHNNIMMDDKVRKAIEDNLPAKQQSSAGHVETDLDFITFKPEPDYIFQAARSRVSVLTAQLSAINESYEEMPRDTSDDYGLLKGFISVDVDGNETPSSFLAYKVYRKSDAAET